MYLAKIWFFHLFAKPITSSTFIVSWFFLYKPLISKHFTNSFDFQNLGCKSIYHPLSNTWRSLVMLVVFILRKNIKFVRREFWSKQHNCVFQLEGNIFYSNFPFFCVCTENLKFCLVYISNIKKPTTMAQYVAHPLVGRVVIGLNLSLTLCNN